MKAYTKYKLKKMGFIAFSLIFAITVISVTVGVVLAATNQMMATNVNVTYVSKEVAGSVSASYKREGDANETAMLTSKGSNKIVFTGEETTTNEGGSFSVDSPIMLTSAQREVVFKYSFTNTGDADYLATIEATNNETNLEMTISKDGTNFINVEDYSLVVFNNTSVPEDYFVKFRIANIAKNADAELNFKWDLKSISKDAVAIYNNQAYENFDEVIYEALMDAPVPETFSATNMAFASDNIKLVTLIKDVVIDGGAPIEGRTFILRSERGATVTKSDNSGLVYISADSELVVGLPYDKGDITFNLNTTDIVIDGIGNFTLNKGVFNNNASGEGTFVNLTGATSTVNINGGTVKNFAVGVQLSDTTSLKMGGSFENCTSAFAGTGNLVFDNDFTLSDTIVTNTALKITGGNVTLTNVTFTEFPGTALIIEGGNVNLINSTVEKAGASSIMISGDANVLIDGCEIKENSVTEVMSLNESEGLAGAGLFIYGDSTVTLKDTLIKDNYISYNNADSILAGSAIATFENSTLNIVGKTIITDNYISSTHEEVNTDFAYGIFNFEATINFGTKNTPWTGISVDNYCLAYNNSADLEVFNLIGDIEINGGTIGSGVVDGVNYEIDPVRSFFGGIATVGPIKVNGGNFNCDIDNSYCITTMDESSPVEINGGEFSGFYKVIESSSAVVINDGTFTLNNAEQGIISGMDITINGGTFSNNTSVYGGVIFAYQSAVLTITGGTFTNNTAENGGVIGAEAGTTLTINGGEFTNNTAENGGVVATNGGNTLTIGGGEFTNNTASDYGGVFVIGGWSNLTISNGTFTNNTARIGGVICTGKANNSGNTQTYIGVNLNIQGVTFTANKVTETGGVLALDHAVGTIKNVIFDGGNKEGTEILNAVEGGAIYLKDGGVNISGTTTIKNFNATEGGAIYLNGKLIIPNENGTNVTISNNKAELGAGIYQCSDFIVEAPINISQNKATQHGGGIYWIAGDTSINAKDSLNVYSNTAVVGGGLFIMGANTLSNGNYNMNIFENSAVNADNSQGIGSGVYVCYATTLSHLNVYNNYGHGIYQASSGGTESVKLHTMNVYGNTAGGIICNTACTIGGETEAQFVDIYNHTTATNGAGISYVANNGALKLAKYIAIHNNVTSANGGGIYIQSVTMDINTENTSTVEGRKLGIYNNTAILGGGLYCSSSTVNHNSGAIYSNIISGTAFGGGLFISGSNTVYKLGQNASVHSNTSGAVNGAGITADGASTLEVRGSVYGNKASTNGGGILAQNASTIKILEGAKIYSNSSANYFGGGVYVNGSTLIMEGGEVYSNTATKGNGGAIYAINSSTVTVSGGEIYSNSAISGGGIYTMESSMNLNGVTFRENTASDGGAGVFAKGIASGKLNIGSTAVFIRNTSTNAGGGLQLHDCKDAVIAGQFAGNKATASESIGGNIYVDKDNTLTISASINGGSTINATSNTVANAASGGAIYISSGSTVTVSSPVITLCKASLVGGGIVSLGTLTFTGTMTNCTAAGGAGIVNAGTLNYKGTITNCNATEANVSNSLTTAGTLNLYASGTIDDDICIAAVPGLLGWLTPAYGTINIKENLGSNRYKITFGEADSTTKEITAVGTGTKSYDHFDGSSSNAIISADNAAYITVDATSGESTNFYSGEGTIKKRSSTTKLYLNV